MNDSRIDRVPAAQEAWIYTAYRNLAFKIACVIKISISCSSRVTLTMVQEDEISGAVGGVIYHRTTLVVLVGPITAGEVHP